MILTYLHLNRRARRTLVRCIPNYKPDNTILPYYFVYLNYISTALELWSAYRSL